MVVEVLLPREGLVAIGAAMRHDSGMLPQVVVKVLLPRERLRTRRAFMRSFTGVLSVGQTYIPI